MAIREYSMTRDSTRQLSPSFRVREFVCKGSDVVLIDDELVGFHVVTSKFTFLKVTASTIFSDRKSVV